jgi:hypothetical protein
MARTKRKALGSAQCGPIYIVDFTDGVTRQRCKNIERVIGKEYVNFSAIAREEDDNGTAKWMWVFVFPHYGDALYQHSPLVVRTITVKPYKMS